MDDECAGSESAAGEVEEPLDDERDDLLSESVVCAPNGDTYFNLGDNLDYLKEARDIGVHVDDLATMFVNGVPLPLLPFYHDLSSHR